MVKMLIEDFILEVKGEIICYDQLGELIAKEWEDEFRKVYKRSRFIKENKGKLVAVLKDETELFKIVDDLLIAVETGEKDKYYKTYF